MIQPIVEGYGEVPSVPVLLRKLAGLMEIYVQVNEPIRQPRSALVNQEKLQTIVELARRQQGCRAILIMFDADDDCPVTLGARILGWAQAAAHPIPCSVVVANREYECWFLAGVESLRGRRQVRNDAIRRANPEAIRDGKGNFERCFEAGKYYAERTDQPAFTELIDWREVQSNSRSCRKLIKEIKRLFNALELAPSNWPD